MGFENRRMACEDKATNGRAAGLAGPGLGLALLATGCFSPNQPIADDTVSDSSGEADTTASSTGMSATQGSATQSTSNGPTSDVTTDATTESTSGSGSETSGASADESESGTTGSALCPNGELDEGEACDDGDEINGNGCNNDCLESGMPVWEIDPGVGEDVASTLTRGLVRVTPEGEAVVAVRLFGLASGTTLVRRFDADGGLRWSDTWTGDEDVIVRDGSLDAQGNIWLVGYESGDLYERGLVRLYDENGFVVVTDLLDPGTGFGGVAAEPSGDAIMAGWADAAEWQSVLQRRSPDGDVLLDDSVADADSSTTARGVRAADVRGFLVCDGGGTGGLLSRYTTNGVLDWSVAVAGAVLDCDARLGSGIAVTGTLAGASWVGVFDDDAVEAWSSQVDGTYGATVAGAAIDHVGSVVAVGTLYGGPAQTLNPNRWIRKFDPSGELLWERTYDYSGDYESVEDVAIDEQDYIYVVGRRDEPDSYAAWLAKFTP